MVLSFWIFNFNDFLLTHTRIHITSQIHVQLDTQLKAHQRREYRSRFYKGMKTKEQWIASSCIYTVKYNIPSGPGSSVGIATDYGLDGPGSNPSGNESFCPSRPALGPTQPPVKWVPGLSRGESAAGACCWPLTPF